MKTLLKKIVANIIVFSFVVALCPSVNVFSAEASTSYTDVTEDCWAYSSIENCSKLDWINGYPDGSFKPDEFVTRAESIKTLVVYLDKNPSEINAENWYTPYVKAAKDILPDDWKEKDGLLPDAPITREETAYLFVKALGYDTSEEYSKLADFSDMGDISESFVPYVSAAVKNGLILGHNDKTIGPKDNLTRAEFATLLWRAKNLTEIREKIENITEIRVPVTEDGVMFDVQGQYFVTEMTVPADGYYRMGAGYVTDYWIGYIDIHNHTADGKTLKFLRCLPFGQTQTTYLMYLKEGKNTLYHQYNTPHLQLKYLKCLGKEENFTYEISPRKATLFLDNPKQHKAYITNYEDKVVKVETADGINIPYDYVPRLPMHELARPMNDVLPKNDAIYGLGEGTHTLRYCLESGYVLEQEIEIKKETPNSDLTYIHFSVDKANATLFRLPNGKYMLVDSATKAMAADRIIPYLEKHNIKLDYYLLTHFHSDHNGLKNDIIKAHNLKVPDADKVAEMVKADQESRYDYLKDFTYLDSTMLCYYDDLDKIWDLGGVNIDILNSRYDENGEKAVVYKYPFIRYNEHNYENSTSVSFMLDYNGFRYYHGADNYAFAQERYMSDMIKANRTEELNCHWFFANHHFIVDYSPIFINTLNPVAVFVANRMMQGNALYETYYKEGVENYYFSDKRLENTLVSGEVGSAKVYVNSADDWCYEIIQDSDMFNIN